MSKTQLPDKITAPKKGRGQLIDLELGRIPPQALELEEAVLGALLIDKNALTETVEILTPEIFYKTEHATIYKAIQDLFAGSHPVDILTVAQHLRKAGQLDEIGGEYYLARLSQKVASSAHVEYHARIIVQKHIQRSLIYAANDIIRDAYDETTDVFELLDEAESKIFEIAEQNIKKSGDTAESLIKEALHNIEEISKKSGLSGVPSGFVGVDKITSGWQKSDLIIVAARPGMGKTAFVLSMGRNIAIDYQIPVAIFSLEMSSVQLITRMISSETGIPASSLRKGNLEKHEWQQLYQNLKNLEKAPIFIDDTPALKIFDLRAKCRRLKAQHNIGIIIIDYLQLMTGGGDGKNGNREQEISMISRSLKSIAKELNVPVIALSQLNRSVETRTGAKRPLLADLRESGAIEQDADIVSFIYRPEYYKIEEWDDKDGSSTAGQAEFIIAKHRNGSLDNIRLGFEDRLAKFYNLEHRSQFEGEYNSKMNNDDLNDIHENSPF
jgi:replicative DNA helicase